MPRFIKPKSASTKPTSIVLKLPLAKWNAAGRKLADQFPKEPAGWVILADAAQGFGGDKARQLYAQIAAKAPTAELKRTAHQSTHRPK
jgi:hypothetical protein